LVPPDRHGRAGAGLTGVLGSARGLGGGRSVILRRRGGARSEGESRRRQHGPDRTESPDLQDSSWERNAPPSPVRLARGRKALASERRIAVLRGCISRTRQNGRRAPSRPIVT